MTTYEIVQGLIIGLIVAACVLHVARKMFPRTVNGIQSSFAASLSKSTQPAIMRRLGAWLQPSAGSGGGCGSGCSTCSTCESNPEKEETKPLEFRRHI
jgi:hypothetical protein